jgi:hypothetical protein
VHFTDVALNDGQVFDSSTFSPNQNDYFWLAVSAVGFAGHSITLAMVSTATDVTNVTQVTLDVQDAAHGWCTSFVDISYIKKGVGVFVLSKHPLVVSSDAEASGENRLYSFVGFQLDNIMKHPFFAVKSDFGARGQTTKAFLNGTSTTTVENVTHSNHSHLAESITICSVDCLESKTNIVPRKAGWYLIGVSIHCRINISSSIADSESAQNKVMRSKCLGSLRGFYSTNSSMWNDTRSQFLPKAYALSRTPESFQNLQTDLVASGSALIFLHPGDVLHPYGGTDSSTMSIVLFSVHTLLYEPAHSYKAAWSVSCVNSDSNQDKINFCYILASSADTDAGYVPYSPQAENVTYDPESMAVQLDINGIYYIVFTASFGYREYTTCSVLQHTKNNTENVLDFAFPSTTSDVYTSTSIQRSRLLLVRESASLTCRLRSTEPFFDECIISTHPTFHGFLLYPV